MAVPLESSFRESLTERHVRLETAIREAGASQPLLRLLEEVDAALRRLDRGSFGLCEQCHDPIETDRLLVDPFLRTCLDHLTTAEQRALERDLALAAEIQSTLLPRTDVAIPGWEIAYHSEPASTVSGDYCDLIAPADGDGRMFFLLGDVSGKGLASSMLMSRLHAIFRSLVGLGMSTGQLLERANTVFCGSILSAQYATLVCGTADTAGRVELCNAGHAPALASVSGSLRELKATGLPMGLFCSSTYTTTTLELAPGDALLLYTDGVSEARDPAGEEYGAERLRRLFLERCTADPEALVKASLDAVRAFRGAMPRGDDLTLMALRYGG